MGVPSLKKFLITALAHVTTMKEGGFNKDSIVIVTAAGVITGKQSIYDPNSKPSENQVTTIVEVADKEYKKNFTESTVAGNDGYLTVRGATLTMSSGVQYTFDNLVVFFDQIIGITVGGQK